MNGNEPAFPSTETHADEHGQPWRDVTKLGLTKREWLAGMAMQGLLTVVLETDANMKEMARDAVHVADALLAEIAKGGA